MWCVSPAAAAVPSPSFCFSTQQLLLFLKDKREPAVTSRYAAQGQRGGSSAVTGGNHEKTTDCGGWEHPCFSRLDRLTQSEHHARAQRAALPASRTHARTSPQTAAGPSQPCMSTVVRTRTRLSPGLIRCEFYTETFTDKITWCLRLPK